MWVLQEFKVVPGTMSLQKTWEVTSDSSAYITAEYQRLLRLAADNHASGYGTRYFFLEERG